jgi:hypothetical protein
MLHRARPHREQLGRSGNHRAPRSAREVDRATRRDAHWRAIGHRFRNPRGPTASGRPELDGERVAAARASAIRDGNDIVDRALGVGQWTADDVHALAESTGTLDGEAAAAIHARVAAAINSDRLKFAPSALRP